MIQVVDEARIVPGLDIRTDTVDRTDADGRFELEDVDARAMRVRLYHPDYEPLTIRRVRAAAGRTWFVTLRPKE